MRKRTWVLFFLGFFVVTGAWSLATPPYASPDEPSHVFRAASVVRGEVLVAEDNRAAGGGGLVTVPRGLVASAEEITCYAFGSDTPADCAVHTPSDDTLVQSYSGAARYNPVYYALVGWPSLMDSGDTGVYLMRLVSAALSAAALATAMCSALGWARSRFLGVGLTVAVTPMAAFLAGMVNPNGLEIALATCVWTSGLALWLGDGRNAAVLMRRIGISGSVMVLTRGLSPLWLALTLVVLAALLLSSTLLRELLRQRTTYVWGGVILLATAASAGWTLLAGADQIPDQQPDASLPAAARVVLEAMPHSLEQYVGTFGWTDAYSPGYSLLLWPVLAGGLVLTAVLAGRRREVGLLVGWLAFCFCLPVMLEVSQFNKLGLFWQARYALPIVIGLPLLATAILSRVRPVRELLETRLVTVVVPLMLTVHLACFYWALRRYQVGYHAPLNSFLGSWSPILGSWTTVAVETLGLVVLGVAMALSPWRTDSESEAGDGAVESETRPARGTPEANGEGTPQLVQGVGASRAEDASARS